MRGSQPTCRRTHLAASARMAGRLPLLPAAGALSQRPHPITHTHTHMWTPTLLPCPALQDGDAFTSGRINTKAHAGFYPGMQLEDGTTFASLHVEARMQLPTPGQGLWPAFWMFPTEPTYGEWAASGEVRAGGLAGCSSWRVQQLAGAKPACRGWRPPSMLPGAGCGCPAAAACTAPSSLVLAPVSPAPLSACPAALDQIDVMESINEMTTITQGLHCGCLAARAAPQPAGTACMPFAATRLASTPHVCCPAPRRRRAAAPENQKSMLRTRQEGKVPYSDGFHTMAVDWSAGRITREAAPGPCPAPHGLLASGEGRRGAVRGLRAALGPPAAHPWAPAPQCRLTASSLAPSCRERRTRRGGGPATRARRQMRPSTSRSTSSCEALGAASSSACLARPQ